MNKRKKLQKQEYIHIAQVRDLLGYSDGGGLIRATEPAFGFEKRRAGISGAVMNFDDDRKMFESLISCGVMDVFDFPGGESKAMLWRLVTVFIY
ncbi:hypothetical protein MIZ03_0137 [Rhodoferax lithotrophicus]|uniref:Uncharacterized protein n=1 Tax=Rhodoferax lithotrophicus TaxID=2798804 RepID=A0ABN6CZW0_9BURK|nr:hypothetical protein [Rhodoferax sp. MIZ03]BCO25277.1 hypothetical protein MIZ03_0137 [Rhodoferax sp. MIZ03]